MTYSTLQTITKAFLIGDNKLPPEPEVFLALADSALMDVASKAESLHLMTLSKADDILRSSSGKYFIRRPMSPVLDTDDIDIDPELTYAVARLIASNISKEKGGLHTSVAKRIILDYNAKTYSMLEEASKDMLETMRTTGDYTIPVTVHTPEWAL